MNHGWYRALGGWRSRTTFVLALSASAVGLGNLWRFSYLAGENGGAPFVITYVLCLFLLAAPILVAEVVIGSYGRGSPPAAICRASDRSLVSRGWMLLGLLACLAGLLLLSCYAVVAGWAMAYAGFMQSGLFSAASAAVVGEQFQGFLADARAQVYWLSVFLAATLVFVMLGVRRGIGPLVWLVVPTLIAMLGVLIKFAFDYGDIAAAREFLFSLKMVDFTPRSALLALGHAFFTLGIGVGIGISYGAYAPERIPIGRSVLAVAVFDTVFALLAGLAIFPVVFANNMEPAMGPGLMFVSVPYAFGNSIQGDWFGAVFFTMAAVAALGSAVAVMEPMVGTLVQLARLRRLVAAPLVALAAWGLGVAVVLSLDGAPDQSWPDGGSLLRLLDQVTAGLLLPLVALLTAVFVGWRLRPELLRVELYRESGMFFALWRFLLRYVVPLALLLIMLAAARS